MVYTYEKYTWYDEDMHEFTCYDCTSHDMNGSATDERDLYLQVWMNQNGLFYYEDIPSSMEDITIDDLKWLLEESVEVKIVDVDDLLLEELMFKVEGVNEYNTVQIPDDIMTSDDFVNWVKG